MKKYLFLIMGIFMLTAQRVFSAVEAVSPDLEGSLKTHTHEPGVMSIVFSLLIVIFLIYVTGLIYSKLNIVGANTVKEQLKNYDLSRATVLSTTQLGQGKNLHVIEIDEKRYLIGATPNSINLIKELESIKVKADEAKPSEPVDEFDVHKKYL